MADQLFQVFTGIFKRLKDMGDGTHAEVVSVSGAVGGSGADDGSLAESDVTTSGTIGTWVELMPANAARNGASVQAVFASGNVFIKQQDSGLPTSGKKVGETQIPAAPAYFKSDFNPKKRYVVAATRRRWSSR